MKTNIIIQGNALNVLKKFSDESIDCIITSPPYYGLRDYGVKGQIGLEKTFDEYLNNLLAITAELKRVLKKTGTMFWNHGDSYGGSGMGAGYSDKSTLQGFTSENTKGRTMAKESWNHDTRPNTAKGYEKCLMLQAHRLAIRMIDEQGWILRNQLIWWKPNCMPSSVKDRFTVDYEPVFFFSKSKKYYFEPQFEPHESSLEEITRQRKGEPVEKVQYAQTHKSYGGVGFGNQGRNKRCVWKIPTQPFSEAHFAVFPEKLIETPIKAGCPEFICKKCGKAREKIIVGEGGSIGKSWHEHENDMEVGAGQISRIGDLANESGEKYRTLLLAVILASLRVDKGMTDCKCKAGYTSGIVLDPFAGAGTTCVVAQKLKRQWIGIELSKDYIKIAEKRLMQEPLL